MCRAKQVLDSRHRPKGGLVDVAWKLVPPRYLSWMPVTARKPPSPLPDLRCDTVGRGFALLLCEEEEEEKVRMEAKNEEAKIEFQKQYRRMLRKLQVKWHTAQKTIETKP